MIHVVARSLSAGQIFLERHSAFSDAINVEIGQRSYFSLLNRLIWESGDDYACVMHDDVLLCHDYDLKIAELLSILNKDWPNWGVVGNVGLVPFRVGYSGTNLVRYISDPHGGPNLSSRVLPAMGIDGNVMLLNLAALRRAEVSLPDFDGFQLYDISLCLEAITSGLGVLVAPQLACWHSSAGSQSDFDKAKVSTEFDQYLSSKIRNRILPTINGEIRRSSLELINGFPGGKDVELDSLRSACSQRAVKRVAIITRTQFSRPDLLRRCLETTKAFISAAGDYTCFEHYLVTDRPSAPIDLSSKCEILVASGLGDGDTRFKLVEFASKSVDADYLWFLDDDDWVFPNEAERLALIISAAQEDAAIFLDCQHYHERSIPGATGLDGSNFRSLAGRYFPANQFLRSLSGQNHTPFCGIIFPRSALRLIPDDCFNAVTYYEDFMSILAALTFSNALPIVVEKLIAGISVRDSGNTITEVDRYRWNRSMSELVSVLAGTKGSNNLLSISVTPQMLPIKDQSSSAELQRIINSRSWKLTKPLRALARIMRGQPMR